MGEGGDKRPRFSSGLNKVDSAVSPPGRNFGFLGLNEQLLVAGTTPGDSTTFRNTIMPGLHRHLGMLGYEQAASVLFFTAGDYRGQLKASGFCEDGPWADHAERMLFADVSAGRKALVETLYRLVADAEDRSAATGVPIVDYMPHIIHVDCLEGLSDRHRDPVEELKTTVQLLNYGVHRLDRDYLEQRSGLAYPKVVGRASWPDGLRGHRIAGVYYTNLDDRRPAQSYRHDVDTLDDFTVPAEQADEGAWKDPNGDWWAWQVQPGDRQLTRLVDTDLADALFPMLDGVFSLHRPRPDRPEDTRGQLIVEHHRRGYTTYSVPLHTPQAARTQP